MNFSNIESKMCDYFSGMIVHKNPQTNKLFSSLGLPSFMRDWLVMRFSSKTGDLRLEEMQRYIATTIPTKHQWEALKGGMINSGQTVRILAKIRVRFDVSTGMALYELPDFAFPGKKFEAVIDSMLIRDPSHRETLLREQECWGVLELNWRYILVGTREVGSVVLTGFKPFQPYAVDLNYFQEARNNFTLEEWIDCLLAGIDYNPYGFATSRQKYTMLCRLLPFVEKRLNLIELAPKGTGKSYLYSQLSKYGWLVSGGSITRARLFYDVASKTPGLISRHDFVTLDEIQSISFSNEEEIRGALKGYLESGEYRVADYHGVSDSGFILLGNINKRLMDDNADMFRELPHVFHESALLDRFHGFIRGWDIPRMKEDMKATGWAFNTEYLSAIFHELRSDIRYRAWVDANLDIPSSADGRDTEAIKRIFTALLKLLFPNIIIGSAPPFKEIQEFGLNVAKSMRLIIRKQLSILDSEYKAEIPKIELRCD